MTSGHDEDLYDEEERPAHGPTAPRRAVSPGLRLLMAVVFGLVLAVSAVAIVVLADRRSDVESELDARQDVVRVAERFTVQVNNYDAESVEDYQASVASLLSTKFKAEFDQAMQDIVQSVQEAEMTSKGTVLASGVATVDQDSARVLVVADADVTTVFDRRQRHFRWEITLVKVDGQWLVDDFTPVA